MGRPLWRKGPSFAPLTLPAKQEEKWEQSFHSAYLIKILLGKKLG